MSESEKCLICGKSLAWYMQGGERKGRGYLGRGYFCTLTCGYKYGMRCVKAQANA